MPRVTPYQELDHLAHLVGTTADGVSIDALSRQLGGGLHRRTLQRRLALLVAQGRVLARGAGRGVRYLPGGSAVLSNARAQSAVSAVSATSAMPDLSAPSAHRPHERGDFPATRLRALEPPPAPDYVPTSLEGAQIRAYVGQPRSLRRPVGYRLAFLEAYQPNHTPYLPEALRRQLHSMGRSPVDQAAAGTFARDILNRLLIDLSWASSQLEGNTYSQLDTERLIEFGQAAEGKNTLETQMILNHKEAIEFLVLGAETTGVDRQTLIALHAFLSNGLMADPAAVGCLRTRAVGIGGSVYLPLSQPQVVDDVFGVVVQMAADITDPFEQAFFLMVHLPYLQPFEDVNKRVSRLAANIPLIRHNLCPLSFLDLPAQAYTDAMLGVYELNQVALLRDVFISAYERSCQQYVAVQQNMGTPDVFRLRHWKPLREVVAAIVRGDEALTRRNIARHLPGAVPKADRERFIALVQTEFQSLHVGNSVRFGIGPLALEAWQRQHPKRR